MNLTQQLAEALRAVLDRAASEVESLHELGRDDEDTAEEAEVAQAELDTARAVLAEYEASREKVRAGEAIHNQQAAYYAEGMK